MTTNRVGKFDDAFISRVHVSIAYGNLKQEECEKIWRQFFKKLEKERKDIMVTPPAKIYVLGYLKDQGWNGREIRNGETPSAYFHGHIIFAHEGLKAC